MAQKEAPGEEVLAPNMVEGRTAVVTGATSGVGRAVAKKLTSIGVDLWAVGRNEAALEEARSWSIGSPGYIRPARIDLTREGEVLQLANEVREEWNELDFLVHSAGVFLEDELQDFRLEDLDHLFDLHVRARSQLTRDLLPLLRKAKGRVVFVNSSLGLSSGPGKGLYSASMHALRALADALRDEINVHDIGVTSLYLGRTATPMQKKIHEREGRPYEPERLIQPDTVGQAVLQILTFPRDAEITDIRLRSMQQPAPIPDIDD